jgi:hypothetical protein
MAADIRVLSVGFAPPAAGTVGVGFRVNGNVTLRNTGPFAPVLSDVTFSLTTPPDCTVSPVMPDIVQNRSLPLNSNVFIGRSWTVTCTQAGVHSLGLTVSAAIDALQPNHDPDLSNNVMPAAGSVTVN